MIGIIFDCDGTLVDSEYTHFLSWKEAFEKRGRPVSAEEFFLLSGNPGKVISERLHTPDLVDSAKTILLDKEQIYLEMHKKGMPSIDRTVNLARELYSQKEKLNIRLAVASAAPHDEILTNLNHIGIADIFDLIVSGSQDLKHYNDPEGVNKPKPYIYLHTAKMLGIKPRKCVAFEDSHTGLTAAVRAGLITFAVPNAYTKHHDFSAADFFVDSHEELPLAEFFAKIRSVLG